MLDTNKIFFPVILIDINQSSITLLCLIVGGGGQIANFWKKTPQVHLIIIRE